MTKGSTLIYKTQCRCCWKSKTIKFILSLTQCNCTHSCNLMKDLNHPGHLGNRILKCLKEIAKYVPKLILQKKYYKTGWSQLGWNCSTRKKRMVLIITDFIGISPSEICIFIYRKSLIIFLAKLLQTALLFKWKYFWASLMESHKVSEFPVFWSVKTEVTWLKIRLWEISWLSETFGSDGS